MLLAAVFSPLLTVQRTIGAQSLRAWQLDDDDTPPSTDPGGRYWFGLLDHQSEYGEDFFPDPFLGPEFDADKQIQFDYAHAEGHGSQSNEVDAEVQWAVIDNWSVSAEVGWSSQHQSGLAEDSGDSEGGDDSGSGSASGVESIDLAVYHPVYQFVSADHYFDYTAALRLDVGIPAHTAVSGGNAQLTPYLGQLLRVGDHVSVQAWTGWQFTIAPNQPTDLIYGATLGYAINDEQLSLPPLDSITPMVELDGQSPLSGGGQDALFGLAGFEAEFKLPDHLESLLQIGYQFPIDAGGRDQSRWGIIVGLYFDF